MRQRVRAGASRFAGHLEERSFTDDRAGADLCDVLSVDVHGEHAVEHEVELVAPGALLDSVSSGSSARRSGIVFPAISSREISRSRALSAVVTKASDSSSPHGVRSLCACRYQALKSIVPDFAPRFPSWS